MMNCLFSLDPVAVQPYRPKLVFSLFRLFFLVAWLTAGPLAADVQTPRFIHITQEQGLSSDTVLAIAEDHRGFMWIGTDDGLNRFDGHEFATYHPREDEPQSLGHSRVQALAVDPEGVLWIGTSGGLDRYDPETDTFINIEIEAEGLTGRSAHVVHSLHQGRSGQLWVGLERGIGRLAPDGRSVKRYSKNDLPRVKAMQEDRDGRLWIGGDGSGLGVFDPQTERFEAGPPIAEVTATPAQEIYALCEDSDGMLWIGSHGGLDRYDPQTGRFDRLRHDPDDPNSLSSNYIDAVLEDRNGLIWVGTDSGGLELIDRETLSITHVPHVPRVPSALSSDVVRTLFENSKGDIWIGTFRGGISFFNSTFGAFTHVQSQPGESPHLTNDQVLSFFEEDDGRLWVGTEDGLNLLDAAGRRIASWRHDSREADSLSAKAVLTVTRDSRGDLWAGTYFGGLNRLLGEPEEENVTFRHYRPDPEDPASLSNHHVWDVFEDSDEELWIATFGGLNRFERSTETFEHFRHDPQDPTSLGQDQVWHIYEDSDRLLWLSTAGGLSAFDRDTGRFRNYASELNVLMATEARHGSEASGKTMWLSTQGYGLQRLDPESGELTVFNTHDGLANAILSGIVEDERGILWVSTHAGVSKFDPETREFTNFSKSDGILATPFNKGAYLETRGGDILLGGRHGFLRLDPSAVPETTHMPPVRLTGFTLFNEEVEIGGPVLERHITQAQDVNLRYDQSVITFTYAALNFRSPESNRYAFRLDPFDDEWSDVGERRSATYTNLAPGSYVFRVKASNNTAAGNETETSIRVTVAPPYWMTWWFRLLVLAGVVSLFLGIHQYKVGNIQALLNELASKNTALKEQMGEIERFAYATSHELTTPLVTIKCYLGAVEQDVRNGRTDRMLGDIQKVSRAADSMEQRLTKLSEYLEQSREAGRSRRRLDVALEPLARQAVDRVASRIVQQGVEVHVQPDMPSVDADPNLLAAVLDVLLDNALKYMGDAAAPTIEIGAEAQDAVVRGWVRDQGIGIDPRYQERIFQLFERLDPGDEGIGLDLPKARKIIEWHGGRLWAESEGTGKGSTFFFTLPRHVVS